MFLVVMLAVAVGVAGIGFDVFSRRQRRQRIRQIIFVLGHASLRDPVAPRVQSSPALFSMAPLSQQLSVSATL